MTRAMGADAQYQTALAAVTAESYREGSARQKQEILWDFISRIPFDPLPSARVSQLQTVSRLLNRAFLRQAFVQDDDVRPPRIKAFHAYGTVAKMRFVADGKHPFTGIFADGAIGFARASLAVGMPDYSPAMSLKFLFSGPHASQNMLLHQSLDTQSSRDFFERAPTNRTLVPVVFPNSMMFPVLRFWLSQLSDPIEYQSLWHLAAIAGDGAPVERPVVPDVVNLYTPDEVHNDPASTGDFRALLAEVPPGTLIYRMYGRASQDAKRIYIGSIIIESAFVASEFGDRILAFRHAWVSKG